MEYGGRYQDAYEASRVEVIDRLATMQSEDDLDSILGQIEDRAATSLSHHTPAEAPSDAEEAIDLAVSVEAWASLVSYAMQRYYIEGPRELGAARLRTAGMSKRVAARLQSIVKQLQPAMSKAYQALGASGFSIGVSFPAGVSVSLSWP